MTTISSISSTAAAEIDKTDSVFRETILNNDDDHRSDDDDGWYKVKEI